MKNHNTKSDVKYAPVLSIRLSEDDKELAELIENHPPNFKRSTFAKYLLTLGAKQYTKYESGDLVESNVDSTKVLELQEKVIALTEQLKTVVDENNTLIKNQTILFRDFISKNTFNQSAVIPVPNNPILESNIPSQEATIVENVDNNSENDIQNKVEENIENPVNETVALSNEDVIKVEEKQKRVIPSFLDDGDDDDDEDDSFAQTFLT